MPTQSVQSTAADESNGEKRVVAPNFITDIISEDLASGGCERVVTRWPPEPNGYIHIGHAKAINLNFGIAQDYGGRCSLRFDDTNPATEDSEYVEAIKRDIRWLGFDWGDNLFFASDYFGQLYEHAVTLIERGLAYVDSLSEAEIRDYRGTITAPGRESPYRNRSVADNLGLLERMRRGEFAEGAHVLRAKIDMAHPNMVMRDPILYRIRHTHHYRTGDAWHIYPLYDFAHGLCDAIEGVTHSLCTLEFETRRELYDWFVTRLYEPPRPHQYEFGRHAIEYTVTGKRKLIELVKDGHVSGWDDPRLPTIAGLRRRGVTPAAIHDFNNRIGVSKQNSSVSIALLEHSIRDDLNFKAPRVMAVLEPLKVIISNYPAGKAEELSASYWPHDVPKEGSRGVPFSRELYIERGDFEEHPPQGFKRLSPGGEVRLRYAYVIRCDEVIKDAAGQVSELRCSYDPATLGAPPPGRKVKGTVHWLSAGHALPAELRLYDRLFRVAKPDAGERPFTDYLNPESLVVRRGFVEPSVGDDPKDSRYQFERQGYFMQDPIDSRPGALVFNRIVTLRDSWAKATKDKPAERAAAKAEPKAAAGAASEGAPRDPLLDFSPEQRARFARYRGDLSLSRDDAALLAGDSSFAAFFEGALERHGNAQGVANWTVNEVRRAFKERSAEDLSLEPADLGALVALVDEGTITRRVAKEVFAAMMETGGDPREIVREKGLEQVADEAALEPLVDGLVATNPDKVEAYRGGKTGLLSFFVGQVMRETQGKANPQLVQELVTRKLA
ncbi:glutamine--tRNA ligase/YqeY domain fusion protein [soil metagenome]